MFLLVLLLATVWAKNSWASAVLQPYSQKAFALRQKTLSVEAQTQGDFVRVRETMVFSNPLSFSREADFTYSAPEGALICGFAYWYKDEKVVARIVEKSRSEEIYQLITRPSHDPALVEMQGTNRFRARIFPVQPDADLKVEVQYLQTLRSFPQQQLARWSFDIGDTKQPTLESVEVTLGGDAPKRFKHSDLLHLENNTLHFSATNYKPTSPLTVALTTTSAPIRGTVSALCQPQGDGFFALALSCNIPLSHPQPKVQGNGLYDILSSPPARLEAGEPLMVTGRYRQGGRIVVSVGARSFTCELPARASQDDASLWWASAKMASLDESERGYEASTALSMRFGLPCRWTNWLAIPTEERKFFEELLATTRYGEVMRHYAQAIAAGKTALAAALHSQAWQLHRQLKFNGKPRFENSLQSELERLVFTKSLVQVPQLKAEYALYERNLRKQGIITYQEQYQRERKAISRAKTIKERVFTLLENGQTQEAATLDLQAQAPLKEARNPDYLVKEWAFERALSLATDVWKQKRAGTEDSPEQQQLLARLHNLTPLTYYQKDDDLLEIARSNLYYDDWLKLGSQLGEVLASGEENDPRADSIRAQMAAIKPLITHIRRDMNSDYSSSSFQFKSMLSFNESNAYATRAVRLADQYVARLRAGQKDDADTFALHQQLEKSVALSKDSYDAPSNAQNAIEWAWLRVLQKEHAIIGREIVHHRPNSPEAQESRKRIIQAIELGAKPSVRAPYYMTSGSGYQSFAWRARAHETAYRLLEARRKQDATLAALLQERLENEAVNSIYPREQHSPSPDEFLQWEQKRIARKEPLLTAEDYYLINERYGVQPGDPLISVKTPYRCRQAIAITPDGQVLKLAFDARRGVWETRFDVPTGQSDGTYTVQVIVVEASGARHHLTLSYDLDTAPDSANARIGGQGSERRIEVQSDGNSDRVHALLPWGERLELPRNADGTYTAPFTVPTTSLDTDQPIKIIVTDAAHNRTEIQTQWK